MAAAPPPPPAPAAPIKPMAVPVQEYTPDEVTRVDSVPDIVEVTDSAPFTDVPEDEDEKNVEPVSLNE